MGIPECGRQEEIKKTFSMGREKWVMESLTPNEGGSGRGEQNLGHRRGRETQIWRPRKNKTIRIIYIK